MANEDPTRDTSVPYEMTLSKDEVAVLRLALHNDGIDPDKHVSGQQLTITEENHQQLMEAVMKEVTTSMSRAHDAKREHGEYDLGEVDVIEMCQKLSERIHHEFLYGPDWRDYV